MIATCRAFNERHKELAVKGVLFACDDVSLGLCRRGWFPEDHARLMQLTRRCFSVDYIRCVREFLYVYFLKRACPSLIALLKVPTQGIAKDLDALKVAFIRLATTITHLQMLFMDLAREQRGRKWKNYHVASRSRRGADALGLLTVCIHHGVAVQQSNYDIGQT